MHGFPTKDEHGYLSVEEGALKQAFVKEVVKQLPEPQPHYNSVLTMVRILVQKGFYLVCHLGKYTVISQSFLKKITRFAGTGISDFLEI